MNVGPDSLLYQLKTRGPQTAAVLAEVLGLSHMGMHKQLQALSEQGLVAWTSRPTGPGRPSRLWQLTPAGHARFPDRHGELAVQIIHHAQALLGPEAMETLIAAREQVMLQSYMAALAPLEGLQAKVDRLAELRQAEGYMARAEFDGQDHWLIEDHCPICAAAWVCQGFCRSELSLFSQVLAPLAQVERAEHQLQGARRCAYRIRASREHGISVDPMLRDTR